MMFSIPEDLPAKAELFIRITAHESSDFQFQSSYSLANSVMITSNWIPSLLQWPFVILEVPYPTKSENNDQNTFSGFKLPEHFS